VLSLQHGSDTSCDIGRVKINEREEKRSASVILCGCAPTPVRSLRLEVCLRLKLQWELQVTAVETIHLFTCGAAVGLCWTLGLISAAGIALKHSHWHKYNCTVCVGAEALLRVFSLRKTSLACCTFLWGLRALVILKPGLSSWQKIGLLKLGVFLFELYPIHSLCCLPERLPICLCVQGAAIPTLTLFSLLDCLS